MNEQYTDIIPPATYRKAILEHAYVRECWGYGLCLLDAVASRDDRFGGQHLSELETLEIGTGPGDMTLLYHSCFKTLTTLDYDRGFAKFVRQRFRKNPEITFIETDAVTYRHPRPIQIAFSSGTDHHIDPDYLGNLYDQMAPGGLYLLIDEFLMPYDHSDPLARAKAVIIWYSHVVQCAFFDQAPRLRREEAKTALDDLSEGDPEFGPKNQHRLTLFLQQARHINQAAMEGNLLVANYRAEQLLEQLKITTAENKVIPIELQKSRRDYKDDLAGITAKAARYGWRTVRSQRIGPRIDIGGLYALLLERPR